MLVQSSCVARREKHRKAKRANHKALCLGDLVVRSSALVSHNTVWVGRMLPQVAQVTDFLNDDSPITPYASTVTQSVPGYAQPLAAFDITNEVHGNKRTASAAMT